MLLKRTRCCSAIEICLSKVDGEVQRCVYRVSVSVTNEEYASFYKSLSDDCENL